MLRIADERFWCLFLEDILYLEQMEEFIESKSTGSLLGQLEDAFAEWVAWAKAPDGAGAAPARCPVLRARMADCLIELTLARRMIDQGPVERSYAWLERSRRIISMAMMDSRPSLGRGLLK